MDRAPSDAEKKLSPATEQALVNIMPAGTLVFETQFVSTPLARADDAEAGLHALASADMKKVALLIGCHRCQTGIVDARDLAIEAEGDQLATAHADQALVAAENSRA